MNAPDTQAGWGLWLMWLLASTVGFLVGGAIGGALFPAKDSVLGFTLAFGASGAVTGLAQWLVLRRRLSGAGWWVLATAVGFATFGIAYGAIYAITGGAVSDAVGFAIVFVLVGAAAGTAQWLVLRRYVPRAGWWVPASTAGFATFGVVTAGAFEAVSPVVGVAIGVALVLLIVLTYGGVTGVTLVWLLRRRGRRTGDGQATPSFD